VRPTVNELAEPFDLALPAISKHLKVLERTLPVPPESIWVLWTEPDHFAAWYGPTGAGITVHAMDVRVGGDRCLSMSMQTPDGQRLMHFAGVHLECGRIACCLIPRSATVVNAARWATVKSTYSPVRPPTKDSCNAVTSLDEEVPEVSRVRELGHQPGGSKRGVPIGVRRYRVDADVGVGLGEMTVARRHPEVDVAGPDADVEVFGPQHALLSRREQGERRVAEFVRIFDAGGRSRVHVELLVDGDPGAGGVHGVWRTGLDSERGCEQARGRAVDGDAAIAGDDITPGNVQMGLGHGPESARQHVQPDVSRCAVLRPGQYEFGDGVQGSAGGDECELGHPAP
jgi:uncharacterized protein YndB with AHSA1/START domain